MVTVPGSRWASLLISGGVASEILYIYIVRAVNRTMITRTIIKNHLSIFFNRFMLPFFSLYRGAQRYAKRLENKGNQ